MRACMTRASQKGGGTPKHLLAVGPSWSRKSKKRWSVGLLLVLVSGCTFPPILLSRFSLQYSVHNAFIQCAVVHARHRSGSIPQWLDSHGVKCQGGPFMWRGVPGGVSPVRKSAGFTIFPYRPVPPFTAIFKITVKHYINERTGPYRH